MSLRSLDMSNQDIENALVSEAGKFSSKLSPQAETDIKQLEDFRSNSSLMSAQTQASSMPLKVMSSSLPLVY